MVDGDERDVLADEDLRLLVVGGHDVGRGEDVERAVGLQRLEHYVKFAGSSLQIRCCLTPA